MSLSRNLKNLSNMEILAFAGVFVLMVLLVSNMFGTSKSCEAFTPGQMADVMSDLDSEKAQMPKQVRFTSEPMMQKRENAQMPSVQTASKPLYSPTPTAASPKEAEPSPFIKYTTYAPYSAVAPVINDWNSCGPKQATPPPTVPTVPKPPPTVPSMRSTASPGMRSTASPGMRSTASPGMMTTRAQGAMPSMPIAPQGPRKAPITRT